MLGLSSDKRKQKGGQLNAHQSKRMALSIKTQQAVASERSEQPMKNGKKPTVAERKHIKSFRLNSDNWLISKKLTDKWLLLHRYTDTQRWIPAP